MAQAIYLINAIRAPITDAPLKASTNPHIQLLVGTLTKCGVP